MRAGTRAFAIATTAILCLASCENPADPTVLRTEARVTEVSVTILESFPVQVHAVVSGELSDGCTRLDSISQSRDGNEFRLQLSAVRPADAICTQQLVLFEENIPLDVRGLKAGDYRIIANGVEVSFRLDADNG
jgi:inhibitor of cysteine peptidase